MLFLSLGPLYGQAFGLSLFVALLLSVALSVVVTAAAFYRYVWTATPLTEAPIGPRFERLFYGIIAFGVILAGLTVPLVI